MSPQLVAEGFGTAFLLGHRGFRHHGGAVRWLAEADALACRSFKKHGNGNDGKAQGCQSRLDRLPAYGTSLALAEWLCRTADRLDPARVNSSDGAADPMRYLEAAYSRETKDADMIAGVLTEDEARRIASNIAKLPPRLGKGKRDF